MDPVDKELNSVLDKLNKIQDEVGGKKKTIILGEDGKSDRFLEIKAVIMGRLQAIREVYWYITLISFGVKGFPSAWYKNIESIQGQDHTGNNAKDIISTQNRIRIELNEVNEEYQELEKIHKAEAKKRRVSWCIQEFFSLSSYIFLE